MSSDITLSALVTPRPVRDQQLITLVDKETLRKVNSRRGLGARRQSKSSVAYLLLLKGIEAVEREQAEAVAAETAPEDRRQGERRSA